MNFFQYISLCLQIIFPTSISLSVSTYQISQSSIALINKTFSFSDCGLLSHVHDPTVHCNALLHCARGKNICRKFEIFSCKMVDNSLTLQTGSLMVKPGDLTCLLILSHLKLFAIDYNYQDHTVVFCICIIGAFIDYYRSL